MHANGKIIQIFLQDKENALCADCQVNTSTHVSVVHGIFICESCASIHNTLPAPFDQTKSIESPLSQSELSYFTHGGNSNFLAFISCYNIPSYSKIPFKYSTTAVHYYSKHLQALALNTSCEMSPPTMEEALRIVSEPENPKFLSGFIETLENSTKEVRKATGEFFSELHEGLRKRTRDSVEKLDHLVQYGKGAGETILHTMESGKEGVEHGGEYLLTGLKKGKTILLESFDYLKNSPLSPVNKK